jgi:hypothetical protein
MNFSVRSFLICIAVTLLAIQAHAEDMVTIRHLDGHPVPNRSSESINVRVSRPGLPPAVAQASKQAVDRFFEQVSAALTANGVAGDWQLAIPDAPAIEITIDINGQKLKLVSSHVNLERSGKYLVTEHGGVAVSVQERAAMLAKQSEAFRRHRIAFETILRLTLERAHARLSP